MPFSLYQPNDAVPAGSMAPEEKTGEPEGKGASGGEGEGGQGKNAESGKGGKAGDDKFAGKSQEEILASYKALEQKLGQQGSELGQLRKQNDELLQMLKERQDQAPTEKRQDQIDQLEELAQKVEDGELDVAEALKLQAQIVEDRAIQKAAKTFQELEMEREAQKAAEAFKQQHPDFDEVKASGILEQIKARNPLHDDMSAYLEWKAAQLAAALEEAKKAGYQEGLRTKAELAEGMKGAEKVLKGQGSEIKESQKPSKPLSDRERREAMLARLQQVRNQM